MNFRVESLRKDLRWHNFICRTAYLDNATAQIIYGCSGAKTILFGALQTKGVLMRGMLRSSNSLEYNDLPDAHPALWKNGRKNVQERATSQGAVAKRQIALVSRYSATTDMEAMDRDLHQARENFAAIFQASPLILCIVQLDTLHYCEVNEAYQQSTGYCRSEVIGKSSLNLGLWKCAEDRKSTIDKLLAQGSLHDHREVFETKTGERLTTLLSAEIVEFGDRPCVLLVVEDITMRQQAEEARVDLAQRLVNAQEAECTRVARELHDNIGQSLALFTMELETIKLALTGMSPDADARLVRLSQKLKALGRDVGNLSHQLHSSGLEFLGLAVAVKSLCREFSERFPIQTECKCSNISKTLSSEVSLCLFRVTQEAFHNIAKHSRAARVAVELCASPTTLHLNITDDGVGFALSKSNARSGLGLTSMRERLHLVGGTFSIISEPGMGTRIEASVPMAKACSESVFSQA
jgi:PAS domain S-box-containing protein